MKHLDDDSNDDILESSYTKTMHGDLVNYNDMIRVVNKETNEVDGVGDSIFHPP